MIDSDIKEVLQTFIICLLIGIILVTLIFVVFIHVQNPNLYSRCLDGCNSIWDSNNRVIEMQLQADCISQCNTYLGEAINKAIALANSTLERINWSNIEND